MVPRHGIDTVHEPVIFMCSGCQTEEKGYDIVPAREIKRRLAEKLCARGLAEPGMPGGSPGMESPDRRDHTC